MTSKARYRGVRPVFGVSYDHTYTIDLRTVHSEHGDPYIWVGVQEHPDYLMPYESMAALLAEWDFYSASEESGVTMLEEHTKLVDRWLDIYAPGEV